LNFTGNVLHTSQLRNQRFDAPLAERIFSKHP
jgi:hypothetical protein